MAKESERPQKENLLTSETQNELEAKLWLAEYESLCNFILNIQRMQHNLIWVNISAVGVLLTIHFSLFGSQQWEITPLLAIPLVSSLLGIYWVAQGIQTTEIGNYIRERIAPSLQNLSHNHLVLGWAAHERARRKKRFGRIKLLQFIRPLLIPRATGGLIFVVTCFIGLGFTVNVLSKQWDIKTTLWSIDCILTLVLIGLGIWLGLYYIGGNDDI